MEQIEDSLQAILPCISEDVMLILSNIPEENFNFFFK